MIGRNLPNFSTCRFDNCSRNFELSFTRILEKEYDINLENIDKLQKKKVFFDLELYAGIFS